MKQEEIHCTIPFQTISGTSVTIHIAEAELNNTVESIIPRIVRGYRSEYNPEDYNYNILVYGSVVAEDTKIKDFIHSIRRVPIIYFHAKLKPEPKQNKWQA